jgi:hypothetical protein
VATTSRKHNARGYRSLSEPHDQSTSRSPNRGPMTRLAMTDELLDAQLPGDGSRRSRRGG